MDQLTLIVMSIKELTYMTPTLVGPKRAKCSICIHGVCISE